MKITSKKYLRVLLFKVFTVILLFVIPIMHSCNKDKCVAPTIDYLTYRDSIPGINFLVPTQVFTIHGYDLKESSIYINNTRLNPTYILDTDTSLTFLMPNMATNSVTEEFSDSLLIVKNCGNDLMMVNILLAPPYINKISNEYALAGETIILEGYFFSLLESAVFPGDIESEIVSDYSDTVCSVIVPSGVAEEGGIILTSKSGEGHSAKGIKFRDRTGLLCNFDDEDNWNGWGGRVISNQNDASLPEANGRFYAGKLNFIEPGTENMNYLILPLSMFDMPDFSGSLSPDYFSLKFEIYSLYAWESGYYKIEVGKANEMEEIEFAYEYNFQPWNDTIYNESFTTSQWETFNIPLSEFRLSTNSQIPIQSYSQLRAVNYMLWSFVNPSEDEGGQYIDHFCVAIDNLRIVQVKSEQ